LDQSNTPDRTDHMTPAGRDTLPDGTSAPVDELPAAPPPPAGGISSINIFIYLMLLGIVVIVYRNAGGFEGVLQLFMVVVGLGFLIFIHELGHFLAAKWCDVHVQTFSIGFGPALPGCSFTRGETTYKIAAIPLGGYVNMVGEGPEADEDENYPRSFKNKSVWQRMVIISAGVIMNLIFGAIAFVIVYRFHGERQIPAVVYSVEPGSPAWKGGVRSGWKVVQIGHKKGPWFHDLQRMVMLSSAGQTIPFTFEAVGDTPPPPTTPILLEPLRDNNNQVPAIGVVPVTSTKLVPIQAKRERSIPVRYDSPAASARVLALERTEVPVAIVDAETGKAAPLPRGARAWVKLCEHLRQTSDPFTLRVQDGKGKTKDVTVPAEGFEFGDSIVGATDPKTPDQPFNVTPLPLDPSQPAEEGVADPFAYRKRMKELAGKPLVLRVQRAETQKGESAPVVTILVPPAFHRTLGVRMKMGKVAALREGGPAAKVTPAKDQVEPGDVIVGATLVMANKGEKKEEKLTADALGPVRLPFELRQRVQAGPPGATWQVKLTVHRTVANIAQTPVPLGAIPWDSTWSDSSEVPVGRAAPMSIPELGIAYWVESMVADVKKGSPADRAGLKRGDVITQMRFREGKKTPDDWEWGHWLDKMFSERGKEKPHDQWAHFFHGMQFQDFPDVQVKVQRGNKLIDDAFEMKAEPDTTWPLAERGLLLLQDTRVRRTNSFVEALVFGLNRSWQFIEDIYLNLTRLLSGRISPKTLGGPVTIARAAFSIAGEDWFTFLLYLGIISVNLAVVNFLPIPVLDGGHMVFLVYELVAGRPPSEKVRIAATYAGLLVILLLMVFVLALDLKRIWPWLPW
jgi:regulator of sigma E protease